MPTILNYLNDREGGGAIIILWDFSAPQCPPLTIPKYFTILMTEVRDAIIFVGFWRPPQCPPPPSPDAIILNYLNNRERGRHISCRILASPMPPPPQTPQYLTILLTERGGRALPFVGFWRPQCPPPPPPDAIILNYLNDREGVPLSFVGFWRPPPPPRLPRCQYLTILTLYLPVFLKWNMVFKSSYLTFYKDFPYY